MIQCPNCQTDIEEQLNFCHHCGTKIEENQQESINQVNEQITKEEVAAGLETSPASASPVKKFSFKPSKKLFVSLGVIVALLLASVVGVNLFLSKNPKELYLYAEWKTAQQQVDSIEASFNEEIALQQKLLEMPSTSEMELSGDVTYTGANEDQGFQDFREYLKESKIAIKTVQDPVNQFSEVTFSYLMKEVNLIDAIIVHTTEHTGLEIPVLLENMLYVNNSEFGDFMETVDPYYEGPDQLQYEDYKSIFALTDEEKERIKKDYQKFFLSSLQDSFFTLTDKVSYSSPEGSVDLRRIDFEMTEQEVQQFSVDFIDHIRGDEELQQMVAEKFVKFIEMVSQEYNQTDLEALTDVDYIKGEIEDALYDMKKEVVNYEFPEGFKMSVFLNNKEQIVDRTLTFELEDEEFDMGFAFDLHTSNWVSKDDAKTDLLDLAVASTKGPENKVTFTSERVQSEGKMGLMDTITANATVVDYGTKQADVDLELSIFHANDTDGQEKIDYEFALGLDGEAFAYLEPEIEGKLRRIVDQDLDKNFSNQEYQLEFVYGMKGFDGSKEEFGIKLDIANDVTFSETIAAPVIKKGAINVSEITESEWYEIEAELEQSLSDFMKNNEEIFNFRSLRYY